jgi:hypothetical protein
MKTEKKNNILKIALMSVALFAGNQMFSQNDTVIIREREVIRDTVVKEERVKEQPPLRKGEFGLRYMPTFQRLSFYTTSGETVQGEISVAHAFGIMFGHNFNKNIGLQAEVNYYEMQQKYRDKSLERQVNLSYLNIPVLLSVNTDKTKMVNWNFVAGPQFGLNIGSSVNTYGTGETETLQATVGAKGGDVGLAYGTGLEFMLNKQHTWRLDAGYRGLYGFVDMRATETGPNTYNVLVKGSRKTHAAYLGITALF